MLWFLVFGLVGFVVSKVANSKDAGLAASTVCLVVAILVVVIRHFNR
jgi:membrane protein DedA with SNARE-associated domain